MRFVELLREVSYSLENHDNDTVSSLLLTAADHIENADIYKLKWAELAERCAILEKENETLLATVNQNRTS